MRLLSFLLSLTAVACLSAELSSQSIGDISPSSGTVGSVVSIDYTGDVGKGKFKVWLTLVGDTSKKAKKYKAKVVDAVMTEDGAVIEAQLKKVVYGTFDVHVQAKVKGQEPTVASSAFTGVPPTVMSGPTPATASPGEEVSMTVMDAGDKRPKLVIGGKKAKAQLDGEQGGLQTITFSIPKSLPNGVWPIEIATKAGTADAGVSVEVTGSSKKLGKAFLTAEVGGQTLKYKGKKLSITNVGNSLQILATSLTNPSKSITIIVPFVEVGTFTQFTLPVGASIAYAEVSVGGGGGSFSSKTWQTNTPPIEVVITSVSGGQFAGTFSGTLVSTGGDADIQVSGEFIGEAQTF